MNADGFLFKSPFLFYLCVSAAKDIAKVNRRECSIGGQAFLIGVIQWTGVGKQRAGKGRRLED